MLFLSANCKHKLMSQKIINYVLYLIHNLGVSASPSGFSLQFRSRLLRGSWSRTVASSGRSAAPCAPAASAFAVFSLQSLAQGMLPNDSACNKLYFIKINTLKYLLNERFKKLHRPKPE